jgi:F0F1-type ATP synthase assembly protein I
MEQTTGNGGLGRSGRGPGRSPGRARSAAERLEDEAEVSIGWKLAGLGFQTASEVGAGALLGWLADRWLNSAPTGLLIGSIAGIAVGLWSLIRGALRLNRQLDAISIARKERQGAERRSAPPPGPLPVDDEEDEWDEDFDGNTDDSQPEDDERW